MTELAVREPAALELLAELERSGAITPTSLDLNPETRYETWEALGGMLGHVHRASCWLIGDWLNFGERVYGETYAQGAAATGLAEGTLMDYAWVASRIAPERRRASVSHSAHRLVAPLEPKQQEAWLAEAEENGWSRRELAANLDPDRDLNGGGVTRKRRSKVDDDLEQHLSEIAKLIPRWESRFVDSHSGKEARKRVRLAEEIVEWLTMEYVPAHAALVTPLAKVPT